MLRILYLVDLHSKRSVINKLGNRKDEVDLVIFGGDITNFNSAERAVEILKLSKEVFQKPIMFVPGNCDDPALLNWEGEEGIIPLHNRIEIVNDLAFFGLGGSNITPFNTFIEFSDRELRRILEKYLDKKIDIFVSHSPPYNTKLDRIYSGNHVGSVEIRKFIEEKEPKLVLTGHIHEGKGVDRIGNSILVNPGPVSSGNYAIITIQGDKIDVKLDRI